MKLSDKWNKKYLQISLYVVITAMLILCASQIAERLPTVFKIALERLNWILKVAKPVVLGFIFAYLVEPLVTYIENKYKKIKLLKNRQSSCRAYAVFTTLIILIILITMIISVLVFSVTDQIRFASLDGIIVLCNEYVKTFQEFYDSLMSKINSLDLQSLQLEKYVKEVSNYILGIMQSIGSNLVKSVNNISGYVTTFIFMIIIGIYFLIDGALMKNYLRKVSNALFSERFNKRVKQLIEDADYVFSGYIRGQLMDAFVMMVLISLTLSIIGVKFAFLIGLLAGFGNLIPYCGPFVAYVGTIIVCLVNGQYQQMVFAIILLFIIQTIDGNVIGPKLLSQSIQIHPLLVIVFLIFGSAIGGLLGMLLAVPVGAFLKVLFVRYIDYKEQLKHMKQMQQANAINHNQSGRTDNKEGK